MPFSKNRKITNKLDRSTIFVSIPSYRDAECKVTLKDIFDKALYPNRVYVGILTQNHPDHQEEICREYSPHQSNIRSKNINYMDASGPLKARSLIAKDLYNNENYYLMIDSHSVFTQDWDKKLIDQLEYLKSKGVRKPILSNYIPDIGLMKNYNRVPIICEVLETKEIPYIFQNRTDVPKATFAPSYFMGAGGMFTTGDYVRDIGLSKLSNLKNIQNGEEILYAMLGYTHGYDIYTPADNLIFHKYHLPNRPFFRHDTKQTNIQVSDLSKIVNFLTKDDNKEGLFNLGKERTIKSYWEKIGFNIDEPDNKKKWDDTKAKTLCKPDNTIPYITK